MIKTLYLKTGANIVFSLLACLVVFFAASSSASAATCTFASVGDNDFNTAGNWDCGHVPIAADDAVIPTNTSTLMSGTATVSSLRIDSDGALVTSGFDLAVNGSVSSTGTLALGGGNTLSIGDDLTFLPGYTFTPANGTVKFTTSTGGSPMHLITSPATVDFYNLVVSTTGMVYPSSIGIAYNVTNNLTVTEGVLYLGNGADLNVSGTMNIATQGAINIANSNSVFTVNGTTTNNGTMGPLNDGVLVLNNDFINNGSVQGAAGETYSLTVKGNWTNTGTFNSGSSTVELTGSTNQLIEGNLIFNNLNASNSNKYFLGNVTTTSDLMMSGNILLDFNSQNVEFLGDVTNSYGIQRLTLRTTSAKNQTWNGGFYYAIFSVQKPPDTFLTFTGDVTLSTMKLISGTVVASPGTITFNAYADMMMGGGTFNHNNGIVTYALAGGGTGNVASTTYNNLTFSPTVYGWNVLTGTTTVIGATTLSAMTKLDFQGNTLIASGTFANNGLITLNGGHIIHTAESVKITDSVGVEVTSISDGGSFYVTVQDANRNLSSSTAETMTVTITTNASAGSDSETLTLTETSSTSGIFRNITPMQVVNSSVVSPGTNRIEISGSGVGTMVYTDNQDPTDTANDTVTLTYTAAAVTTVGGGGGGSGDPYVTGIPPLVPQLQQLLDNLKAINVDVHNLVKLPDDGNADTQYDSAVYYVATDGKRHAFPNEKVYFTWYANFDSVKAITAAQLASIPLGANVTYKPGKKMVKFTSDNKVYAVAKGGILRWVVSEAAAKELYGTDWSNKIDDIDIAFYVNYKFGDNVTGLADFNPATVEASALLPSDSLQM